jgi:hypothetical protein
MTVRDPGAAPSTITAAGVVNNSGPDRLAPALGTLVSASVRAGWAVRFQSGAVPVRRSSPPHPRLVAAARDAPVAVGTASSSRCNSITTSNRIHAP